MAAKHESGHQGGSRDGGGSSGLKQREYRDEKGEVHHHTRTYGEQHGKEHGSSEPKS